MISGINIKENKRYISLEQSQIHSLLSGYYLNSYVVEEDMMKRLSKDLGFSYELYKTLESLSGEAAESLVTSMAKRSQRDKITILVDDGLECVLGYTFEDRTPLLNSSFLYRSASMVEASDHVTIAEVSYLPEDKVSTILVKKKDTIDVVTKYLDTHEDHQEYEIGILLINDEANTVSCRLVLYVNDHPLYLPASYYNTTLTRYKRSTSNSEEALEVLMLKVLDDLRGDTLLEKLKEVHYKYRHTGDIVVSYEEYNSLLKAMRKIPTIIDNPNFLDTLTERYESFEEKYNLFEEKKSSYIWRCTAFSDLSIKNLIYLTTSILNTLGAPSIECFNVREILGSYVSTSRIVQEIASESSSVE